MSRYVGAAYVLVALVLGLCALNASKSKKAIAGNVKKLLSVATLAVGINLAAMFVWNMQIATFLYGVLFATYDWVVYYMFRFSVEYAGEQFEKHVKVKWMWLLLWADGLQLMANVWLGHAFMCKEYFFDDGSMVYSFSPLIFYYIHLLVAYMLVLFCFITLFYKCMVVPYIYRIQYANVLVAAIIVLVANVVYLMKKRGLYVSVFFFVLVGLVVYYYALVSGQRKLLHRMYTLLFERMEDPVILFGMDGICANVNPKAEEFFAIPHERLEQYRFRVYKWCEEHEITLYNNTTRDLSETINGREVHYRIQCRRLEDSSRNYLGSYLIIHDRTEEVEQDRREKYRATRDGLTGLFNKEYFYAMSEKKLRSASKDEYYVICSDVKNFKMVNDVFGNEAGDRLLVKVAEALIGGLGYQAVYGRLDNDRFGIVIKKALYDEQKLLQLLQEAIYINTDEYFTVNMYLGVYEVEDRRLDVSIMCDRARMALETVKGDYEKKIAYYDSTLRENVLNEQKLARDAEIALAEGQFVFYLQPQIDIHGNVLGGEALVRWQHPDLGLVMPGVFIGVLEKNGMIAKLDYYIWELACKQLRAWKDEGRDDMYISVNISPKDFYFMNIYEVFMQLVEKYEISPHKLKLEITETAVMSNLEKQLQLIEQLRAVGFVLEMDDFGSGYSSLNMLKDIKVDMLKIDMAFLGKTDNEERSRKILKVIIDLSKQLEMPTIVEGVETDEQVQFLKEVGCDIFQGYYFAKPMDVESFERKYMGKE